MCLLYISFLHALLTMTHKKMKKIIFPQDLFQMGATSYPGMTQPFSMSHSSNMGSVGVRQDSMGKCCDINNDE